MKKLLNLNFNGKYRFILNPAKHGFFNMAIDEALSIRAQDNPPVIRFYSFSPPCLSVGRFQKTRDTFVFEKLKEHGIDFIRRPTGGRALFHDNELTYSVILCRKHISPFRKRQVYRFIAGILIQGLKALGISTDLNFNHPNFNCKEHGYSAGSNNPDCFEETGEYEIVTCSGKKIIGSAQAITRHSYLQHGSIPLDRSKRNLYRYMKPFESHNKINPHNSYKSRDVGSTSSSTSTSTSTCLEEELGRPVSYDEAVNAFYNAFKQALPSLEPSKLSIKEMAITSELIKTKYTLDSWNLTY